MKKIFGKYTGKDGGGMMLRQLLAAMLGILMCAVALCSATYAWFVSNVESGGNRLESGRFELGVSVSGPDGSAMEVIKRDNGYFECQLPATGDYTVTLTMKDSSVSRGFCRIEIGDEEYITDVIGRSVDESREIDPFVFALGVKEANAKATFKPCWGIPSSPTVENGGKLPSGE